MTQLVEPGVVEEIIRIKEQPGNENDLHHDERRDAACCHTCLKALQSGMLTSPNADPAFKKNGFSNWKNTMEKKKGFQRHEIVSFAYGGSCKISHGTRNSNR